MHEAMRTPVPAPTATQARPQPQDAAWECWPGAFHANRVARRLHTADTFTQSAYEPSYATHPTRRPACFGLAQGQHGEDRTAAPGFAHTPSAVAPTSTALHRMSTGHPG